MPLKNGNRKKGNLAQFGDFARIDTQMANKIAIRLVLVRMILEQFQRQLLEQHIVVFVYSENAFSDIIRYTIHASCRERKFA